MIEVKEILLTSMMKNAFFDEFVLIKIKKNFNKKFYEKKKRRRKDLN